MDGARKAPGAALTLVVLMLLAGGEVSSTPAGSKRVDAARERRQAEIDRLFREAGVDYPPPRLFLRAYKLERELELWAAGEGQKFTLVKTYPVCTLSGRLGPKRREGDLQVPEGIYRVDRFNPQSRFHLSLGIDYPNPSDRKRGDPSRPGGEIFIHGDCVTIGCLPITDEGIEEVYLIALDSKSLAGRAPAVHIYPCRMDRDGCRRDLERLEGQDPGLKSFWDELLPVHNYFERERVLPGVTIDRSGAYRINTD